MRKIAEIVKNMKWELNKAEHYADLAIKYKDEDKSLSSTYKGIATTKLSHVDTFHTQATRTIADHKAAGKTAPAGMQAIWDWEHEQIMHQYAEVKALIDTAGK